jgi:hypothetical protein
MCEALIDIERLADQEDRASVGDQFAFRVERRLQHRRVVCNTVSDSPVCAEVGTRDCRAAGATAAAGVATRATRRASSTGTPAGHTPTDRRGATSGSIVVVRAAGSRKQGDEPHPQKPRPQHERSPIYGWNRHARTIDDQQKRARAALALRIGVGRGFAS